MAPMPNSLQSTVLLSRNYNIQSSNIIGVVKIPSVDNNHFEQRPVKIMNVFRGSLELKLMNPTLVSINLSGKSWQMYLRVTFNDDQIDKVNEAVHQIKLKPFTSNLMSS
jgi:hypothetical protein